jgi:hypothetical protein
VKEVAGFPRVGDLKFETGKLSASDFAQAYPRPALHLVLKTRGRGGERSDKSTKERSFERTAEIPQEGTPSERYNDRIAFLTKREGNPFPHMISVGRALNNDLVIVLSTISKLHGYFLAEGDSWSFIDHRSRNGTRVNDEAVAPGERRPLTDGDRIKIGLELQAVFLTPASLHYFLSRSSPSV